MNTKAAERTARIKQMKAEVEALIKPGDLVERVKGRLDTFLGLFEYTNEHDFINYGYFALVEFTEARGHRTKTKVRLPTFLRRLKEPWTPK
jgi:hypothetical protein